MIGTGTPEAGGATTCDPNLCPQPTGACCNPDQSCTNEQADVCIANGGTFQGAGTDCGQGNIDCGLTPFVDALPIPPIMPPTGERADGVLQYTVAVDTASQNVHSELPDTERRVITMYYREGLLLREIGAVLGVTESRVSQIHSRALARLQDMLREEEQ